MKSEGEAVRKPRVTAKDGSYSLNKKRDDLHYVIVHPVPKDYISTEDRLLQQGYFKIDSPHEHGIAIPKDGTIVMACMAADVEKRTQNAVRIEQNRRPSPVEIDGAPVTVELKNSGAVSLDDLKNTQVPESDFEPVPDNVAAIWNNE